MTEFHFLRPAWLLLLLCLPLLLRLLRHPGQSDSGWSRLIPEHLLAPLVRAPDKDNRRRRRYGGRLLMALAWCSLVLALAGPAWRMAPTPVKQPGDSLVMVLDLSLSMLATDVTPDRLTQAKRKIRDILQARAGSLNALVVYAADSHVVTPLTDDSRTIEAMLSVLEPVIMPAPGNRADLAISRALDLLARGAPGRGRILLISDSVDSRYHESIRKALQDTPYTLDTLVVGTRQGGPIPLARRGFIRDNGQIVISRADPEGMAQLARDNGGRSHRLTLDDTDIRALSLLPSASDDSWQENAHTSIQRWQDDGYWLLWLALPLLLLGWRRGLLAAALLAFLPLAPAPAQAADWDSLWLREDQRAPALIEQDPEEAAQTLESPEWKASALYRAGRYDEAARLFGSLSGADAAYNRGNALARAGRLEEALRAYDEALAQAPDMDDARHNRRLVQQLLQQQRQQSQQPSPGQDSQPGNNSSGSPEQESHSGHQNGGQPSQNHSGNNRNDDHSSDKGSAQPSDSGQEPPEVSGKRQEEGREQADNDAGAATAEALPEVEAVPLSRDQEQWLRRIPDDPGGLLRRKFLQQYQQRQTAPDEGDTPW